MDSVEPATSRHPWAKYPVYGLNGLLAFGFFSSGCWALYKYLTDLAYPYPGWPIFTGTYVVYHFAILFGLCRNAKWLPKLITFDSALTLFTLLFSIVALAWMLGLSPGRHLNKLFGPYIFLFLIFRGALAMGTILYFKPICKAPVTPGDVFKSLGVVIAGGAMGIIFLWFAGGVKFIDKHILKHNHPERHPDAASKAVAEEMFSKITCDEIRAKNGEKETHERGSDGETYTINIHYAYGFTGVFVKNSKCGTGMKGGSKKYCEVKGETK